MSAGDGAAWGGFLTAAAVTAATVAEGSAAAAAVVAGGPFTLTAAGLIAAGTAVGAGVGKFMENSNERERLEKEAKLKRQ